jgi:transposase-like protein
MAGKRTRHTAGFKAQVALAALQGDRTVNEVAAQHSVHPQLIHTWKKRMLAGAETVFACGARANRPARCPARRRNGGRRRDERRSGAAAEGRGGGEA